MILKAVQFFAVILTALAPVPAGAHIFELPNKISLSQEQYFTVQGMYRGWALLGFVLLGAIGANLVHAILIRDVPRAFWFALVAFLLMLASLAIFFIWIYPANQATSNWTVAPATQKIAEAWCTCHEWQETVNSGRAYLQSIPFKLE